MIGSKVLQNADMEVSVYPSLRLDLYDEPIRADSIQLVHLLQCQEYGAKTTDKSVRAVSVLTLAP
jgi:hypothetical protein